MFTKAVTLPRPQENVDPYALFSTTAIIQKSAAKQHPTIHASLNKTIWFLSKYGNVDKLLLLWKSKKPYVDDDFTKLRPLQSYRALTYILYL